MASDQGLRMSGRIPLIRTFPRALSVFGLAFTVAACGGLSSPTEPARTSTAEVELGSYQLLNDARRQQGVQPQLALDESLSGVARSHSEAMRDQEFFGHLDSNGNMVDGRLRAAGVSFTLVGENLVRVSGSGNPAVSAHALLMASGGHRDNILSPDFQRVGVGAARRGDTYWITQVFIKP